MPIPIWVYFALAFGLSLAHAPFIGSLLAYLLLMALDVTIGLVLESMRNG